MTCKDLMTSNPVCCVPQDSAARAAQLMKSEDVGPVPIVNNHAEKKLVGIVTDRDLALKVVAEGRDANSTRLEDVMSTDLVTCSTGDDIDDVLDSMAEYQVRRIPVVDENKRLVGIIAQADVARYAEEEDVGEVVEEISGPSGTSAGSHDWHTSDGGGMGGALLLLGGLGVGAGIMYLLDPDRGRTRRAYVRDKAAKYSRQGGEFVDKVRRDVSNRAHGIAHEAQHLASEAKSKLSGTGEPVDETIQAARDASRHGRFEFMQRNWSPAARVFAGALGGGMLLYGMKSRGRISKPMSALGVGLLTRGITNREFTSMPAAVRSMVGL